MVTSSRYRSSLEAVLHSSWIASLEEDQRTQAKGRFYQIVDHFKVVKDSDKPYSRPLLIQHTYEYARSEESQDKFLRVFFDSMGIPLDGNANFDYNELKDDFNGFANYLLEDFFLPITASGGRTAQPTPKYAAADYSTAGTPDRLATLRAACLIRDRHRCVVSHKFDASEVKIRAKRDGKEACDDNGVLLVNNQDGYEPLEVAHILPHSLTEAESENQPELAEAKKSALNILDMFDSGVVQLIKGNDIDQPRNALTIAISLHRFFESFEIYFEELPEAAPDNHTYRIAAFMEPYLERAFGLPVTRTFYDTKSIDPPSRRLLAIHRAIAHILHLSGAGDYIDTLFRDMDTPCVQADGSSRLDVMVKLRLGGWWDGAVRGWDASW